VKGEGETALRGGPRGDLHLAVGVRPNDWWDRAGDDLLCTIPATFSQAALGAERWAPSLRLSCMCR
jgi:molecular chaperone DnaJ